MNTDATLRPRNRRLISIEDELPSIEVGLASPPINSSRSSSNQRSSPPQSRTASRTGKRWKIGGLSTPSTGSFSILSPKVWEDSWSSLQNVATTLWGADVRDAPRSATLPKSRNHPYGGTILNEWGPTINVERSLATGSQEDRLAQVQAKKREILLTANGHSTPDSTGKYKRKLSMDKADDFTPLDQSGDALVYLHKVLPSETSMGIAIKYSCREAVLRKANRLWPNDSIQLRRTAYVPVDACAVRGKKIESPGPSNFDILSDGSNEDAIMTTPTPTSSTADWTIPLTPKAPQHSYVPQSYVTPDSTTATSPAASTNTSQFDTSPPYSHDSWVQIASFSHPTEIVRLPRRTLGFFPPARRKSILFADSTPPPSSPYISPTLSPTRRLSNGKGIHSPNRRPASLIRTTSNSHTLSRTRTRSAATTPAQAFFASQLRGPGGVGTLDAGASGPGPAQDKLNQLFAPHLPDVNPRTSFESVGSNVTSLSGTGTGLENLGGKVEGWVRKIARSATEASIGGAGTGKGERDLIELVEGWEIGGGGGSREPRRGGEVGPNDQRGRKPGDEQGGLGIDEDRDNDDEARLGERFLARGRVFEEQGRGR